tara:strand:- start:380 stop:484 length:105 start_codon:yes stop_codon:yes gene_type:complete
MSSTKSKGIRLININGVNPLIGHEEANKIPESME